MIRFGLVAAVTCLSLACGGEREGSIRATNEGELWLATPEVAEGNPDLEIDFGSVSLGEQRSLTIDAFNAGADPISVTRIQFDESTDGSFYLNAPPLPIHLAPDERFSVRVAFSPRAEGSSESRLVMTATGRTSGARGWLKGLGQQ